ncbi:hypothetical protein RCL1_001162 [Eukaryota sp. TZLM3-RCL]
MQHCTPCLLFECSTDLRDFIDVEQFQGGSQGSIFLTRDRSHKPFCKKVVPSHAAYTAKELRYALRPVHSPYLIEYIHCFKTEYDTVFIQEYCEGGSLFQFLQSNPSSLTSSDIGHIFSQLLLGVSALHNKGYVHRDIKPANILFVNQQRPFSIKLCDLGISKNIEEQVAASSVGTLVYSAPEQIRGNNVLSYSFGVDLFALGAVLYELVEGRVAFPDAGAILDGTIPTSNSEWGPVISRLLVCDPSQRATIEEIVSLPIVQRYLVEVLSRGKSIEQQIIATVSGSLNTCLEDKVKQLTDQVKQLQSVITSKNSLIASQKQQIESLGNQLKETLLCDSCNHSSSLSLQAIGSKPNRYSLWAATRRVTQDDGSDVTDGCESSYESLMFKVTPNNFGVKLFSPAQSLYGCDWQIWVRLGKVSKPTEVHPSDQVAFFVKCLQSTDETHDIHFVIQNNDPENNFISRTSRAFSTPGGDWGFEKTLTLQSLIDPNSGFIQNGQVVFEVRIFPPRSDDVSTLYSFPLPRRKEL